MRDICLLLAVTATTRTAAVGVRSGLSASKHDGGFEDGVIWHPLSPSSAAVRLTDCSCILPLSSQTRRHVVMPPSRQLPHLKMHRSDNVIDRAHAEISPCLRSSDDGDRNLLLRRRARVVVIAAAVGRRPTACGDAPYPVWRHTADRQTSGRHHLMLDAPLLATVAPPSFDE